MSRLIKIILLFATGLILGLYFVHPITNPKVLPIFSHLPDFSSFEETVSTITVVFTGDVMLGRSVNTRIQKNNDPTWPFKNIAPILSNADVTIINLESPFLEGCKPIDTGMIFCADPKNVAGLKLAGIDFASLSNNHINNQGQKGIEDTISILQNNGIVPTGLGKPEFDTVKNTKLAILSYSDFPQMDEKIIVQQVLETKKNVDLVIVTFHWGVEYQKNPTSRQIFLAHLAIDSGADIVVGNHPHWIQTEETYLGKPIYYSLGNLVFDQMWSEQTRLGEILRVTYQNNKLLKKEIIPIKIFDFGQPSVN